jgi:hypothetical protein
MLRGLGALLIGFLLLSGRGLASDQGDTAMGMREIVKEIGAHTEMFSEETGYSLPIPVVAEKKLLIARLAFGTRVVPQQGVYVMPPSHKLMADYATGKFIAIEELDVRAAGIKLPPAGEAWMHQGPQFATPQERIAAYERLWELCDLVLPPFAARRAPEGEAKKAIKEFRELFDKLAEKPIQPYYEVLGKEFVTWLEQNK